MNKFFNIVLKVVYKAIDAKSPKTDVVDERNCCKRAKWKTINTCRECTNGKEGTKALTLTIKKKVTSDCTSFLEL